MSREISKHRKPILGITMGDPSGVGPEIVVKALSRADLFDRCRPFVVGDANRLRIAAKLVGSSTEVREVKEPASASFTPGVIDCIDVTDLPSDLPFGKLSAQGGDAAYQYIACATKLAMEKEIDAICTAPINKEALHLGGHKFPGHTELLAHLTGTEEVSLMLVTPRLRVIHVTCHIGLREALDRIEPALVERTILRGHDAIIRTGIANPRIAVCGVNPHAGENGLFGNREEETQLAPAIEKCRARGWNIEGPLPADTLFYRASRGDFDLVVAMYHDQGHGPVKVLGIEEGVNVTIGLPIVRTSVDHGTAFDIAGKGIADDRSMVAAIDLAIRLAE